MGQVYPSPLSVWRGQENFHFLGTRNAHIGASCSLFEYLLLGCNTSKSGASQREKGPERRSGCQKRTRMAFRSETNPCHERHCPAPILPAQRLPAPQIRLNSRPLCSIQITLLYCIVSYQVLENTPILPNTVPTFCTRRPTVHHKNA